jgi:hypothetical protein
LIRDSVALLRREVKPNDAFPVPIPGVTDTAR